MHMHTCQLNIFAMLHIRGNLSQTALVLLGQNTLSKHVKKLKLTAFVSAPDTERTKSGEKKIFCKHSSVTLILEKKKEKKTNLTESHQCIGLDQVPSVSDRQTLNCHVETQPEAAPLTAHHWKRWRINRSFGSAHPERFSFCRAELSPTFRREEKKKEKKKPGFVLQRSSQNVTRLSRSSYRICVIICRAYKSATLQDGRFTVCLPNTATPNQSIALTHSQMCGSAGCTAETTGP